MTKKRYAITTLIATMLMMGLATSAWADSDSDSDSDSDALVGSWSAVSTLEPSGEEAPGLFTFNGDRTWIASANDLALSNAHGAWEHSGSRNFEGTSRGFVFGSDGTASLRVENRVSLTVSSGGDSFTAEFETDISLFDGTVIESFSGTSTGTRIVVEPF